MEKHLFKIGDKYFKESIEYITSSFNDTSITEKDNTLKLFVSGIEKMPGEYRIDYVCTFIKEANSYIAKEESYNEVITNFTLFNYSKIITFIIFVFIALVIWII